MANKLNCLEIVLAAKVSLAAFRWEVSSSSHTANGNDISQVIILTF
jgi:hypothetical protein